MCREEFRGIGRRQIGIAYRKTVGFIILDRFQRFNSRTFVNLYGDTELCRAGLQNGRRKAEFGKTRRNGAAHRGILNTGLFKCGRRLVKIGDDFGFLRFGAQGEPIGYGAAWRRGFAM